MVVLKDYRVSNLLGGLLSEGSVQRNRHDRL